MHSEKGEGPIIPPGSGITGLYPSPQLEQKFLEFRKMLCLSLKVPTPLPQTLSGRESTMLS